VVILTAGYILWAIQRVYLGPEYKGPHPEALTPITNRELAIASPLLAFAILFGVYPRIVLDYMQPTVDEQVEQLAAWTERNRPAAPAEAEATAAVEHEMALAAAP
jgi:NADH-quinone oxidoreductase subunit M